MPWPLEEVSSGAVCLACSKRIECQTQFREKVSLKLKDIMSAAVTVLLPGCLYVRLYECLSFMFYQLCPLGFISYR